MQSFFVVILSQIFRHSFISCRLTCSLELKFWFINFGGSAYAVIFCCDFIPGPASGDDQHEKSPTVEEASVPEEEDTELKSPTEETDKSLDASEEAPAQPVVKEEEEDVKDAWDLDSEEEEEEEGEWNSSKNNYSHLAQG